VTTVLGINPESVGRWLEGNVAGAQGPFIFEQIAGGRSNLTYRVADANNNRYVLRRPPLGHVLATAHDVAREHRIISGVARAATVPVAPALGLCTDNQVNEAPFYVMGFVEGAVLDSVEAGRTLSEPLRTVASHDLVRVLSQLHAIEPDAVGLGELGKREGYVTRQLKRWSTQWENSRTRELPLMDDVRDLLAARMPVQRYTGIAHGDYRFGNCMVDPATGRVVAVLDWELCTLGDQLADVGYLLMYWSDPGGPILAENDPSGSVGYLSRSDVLNAYATATRRDPGDIGYYEAFSCWRLACIAEGVLHRYMVGVMGESEGFDLAGSQARVEVLAHRAAEALRRV
jgi:aminoglycoside phosphotransferase (APT) family kinase protein